MNIVEFRNSFKLRVNEILTINKLSDLYKQSSECLLKFPGVESVAVFTMNQVTFDFANSIIEPIEETEKVKQINESLIDSGKIGETLSTGSIIDVVESFAEENVNIKLAPLLTANGIVGYVQIIYVSNIELFNQDICDCLNLYFGLMALKIENIRQFVTISKLQEGLDQKIASRTISLVENQHKLKDKLKNLKANLSMTLPHEIRTPLNILLGNSEFLLKNIGSFEDDDIKEMLTDIVNSGHRLLRLFENYLFFSNLIMMANNMSEIQELRRNPTYNAHYYISSISTTKAQSYDRFPDLNIQIAEANIAISEEYLGKLLNELLDNALKYSNNGDPINIRSEKIGDLYILSITDHGRGMTEEQIRNIDSFTQFERSHYEQQGFGLGLAIVAMIVKLHEGSVSIKSVQNHETTVAITLPLATSEEG